MKKPQITSDFGDHSQLQEFILSYIVRFVFSSLQDPVPNHWNAVTIRDLPFVFIDSIGDILLHRSWLDSILSLLLGLSPTGDVKRELNRGWVFIWGDHMFGLVKVVSLKSTLQSCFVFGEFLNVLRRLVKVLFVKCVVHLAFTAQLFCPFHQLLPVYELLAQRPVIITVNQRRNQVINYFSVQNQALYFWRWYFVQVFALFLMFLHYLQRLLKFFFQFAYELIVWLIVHPYIMQFIFVKFWICK